MDNAVLDAGTGEFYTADILADGLYRVGMVNSDTTAVSGVITDENSDPIHAATVYLEGVNYGYQQVVITDASGSFS
ncbi:MAG: carboxypeptidase regulatory-like domain-containing protein, partial [Desulfuromonadales bacterium]|nr:carboxypeptidase regulatory-like domain-containing protein [Desulfuromonadales bacterium]